jgi:DNA-binding XRE family transcriptional regulator
MTDDKQNQGWQTVHYKTKKSNYKNNTNTNKQKFSPIPSLEKTQNKTQTHTQTQTQSPDVHNQHLNPNLNTHQDWNYVVLLKPPSTQVHPHTHSYPNVHKEASSIKTNNLGDIIQVKKISPSMAKSIVDARVAKKLTQIQLAHLSGLDIKTVSEIEKGGGLYNPDMFNKLCSTLGVKIERNYILERF